MKIEMVMMMIDDNDGDRVGERGWEEEEKEWTCPKKNKNPTLRMWGTTI